MFYNTDANAGPTCHRTTVTLKHALTRHGLALICNNNTIKLVKVITSTTLTTNNRIVKVVPRDLGSGRVNRDNLAHLRIISNVRTHGTQVTRLDSTFVTLPNNLNALRRLFRI